jgi:hypothetical protein
LNTYGTIKIKSTRVDREETSLCSEGSSYKNSDPSLADLRYELFRTHKRFMQENHGSNVKILVGSLVENRASVPVGAGL